MPSKVQFWRCGECDKVSETVELLRAPNPFNASEEITGCPACGAVENFAQTCDYPGCRHDVSSGTPMPDGDYVNRCWQHSPRNPAFVHETTAAA